MSHALTDCAERAPSTPARFPAALEQGGAALFCALAALAATWPLAANFTSHLAADAGDPLQTLWSWNTLHDALHALRNPFVTDLVYFPHGASLVFMTFDLPTACLTLPLWHVLPPVGVYNAGLLFAFWLTAWGCHRLVYELTRDRAVALCAGLAFTAVPYHFAHAAGHMHLLAMGWIPLYLVHLHRMIEGRAARRDPILGGLFLALATLASFYHLLFAMVLTPVLFVHAARHHRGQLIGIRFLKESLCLGATFMLVAGPLVLAVLHQRSLEPIAGAHSALTFSGDLQSFFVPNLVQRLQPAFGAAARRWTGNGAEIALYAGYTLLVGAILSAIFAGALARAYLAMAALGAVLALGPVLHVGGKVLKEVPLPYALLVDLLPPIEFMGVPVRLGYVMYLGLVVAAAMGLAHLRGRLAGRPVLRWTALALPTALLLAEYAPKPRPLTALPTPAPMLDWARSQERFAVLDLSGPYRMMWHALLHRKPMPGGNLTRVPARLERWYRELPIVRHLGAGQVRPELMLARVDQAIDFDWGNGRPDPSLPADRFSAHWQAALQVPTAGRWRFFLSSDDGAWLSINGRRVVDNGGAHPMQQRSGAVELAAGRHALSLRYKERAGQAGIRLEWSGPGVERSILGAPFVSSADGRPGFSARFFQERKRCGISREQGRSWLRALDIRYVVTGAAGDDCLADELGLPTIWARDGVRIYRVEAAERVSDGRP